MRARARYAKLGALAVLATVALVIVVLALGLREQPTVSFHTYFDESVQGLDEGAIVKFRGVRIGKVAAIRVAPDRALIDVELAVDADSAGQLRLDEAAPNLRTKLVLFGITGVKLIDIDFADPAGAPPPPLAFTPARRFIPSSQSLLGSLEGDLQAFARRLPALVDQATQAFVTLDRLAGNSGELLADSRAAVASIARVARKLERSNVPVTLEKTLGSIEELGRSTLVATTDLEDTVRDIGDAARALRDFLDTLEREPDILVKGRARPRR